MIHKKSRANIASSVRCFLILEIFLTAVSVLANPSPIPSPGYPACNVCGVPGESVTKLKVSVTFPGQSPVTCAELQYGALSGFVNPIYCPIFATFNITYICGCKHVPTAAPTIRQQRPTTSPTVATADPASRPTVTPTAATSGPTASFLTNIAVSFEPTNKPAVNKTVSDTPSSSPSITVSPTASNVPTVNIVTNKQDPFTATALPLTTTLSPVGGNTATLAPLQKGLVHGPTKQGVATKLKTKTPTTKFVMISKDATHAPKASFLTTNGTPSPTPTLKGVFQRTQPTKTRGMPAQNTTKLATPLEGRKNVTKLAKTIKEQNSTTIKLAKTIKGDARSTVRPPRVVR
jgi:hypothetical protein